MTCADKCRPNENNNFAPDAPFLFFDIAELALALRRKAKGRSQPRELEELNNFDPCRGRFDVIVALQIYQEDYILAEIAKFFLKPGGFIFPDIMNKLKSPEFNLTGACFYRYSPANKQIETILR